MQHWNATTVELRQTTTVAGVTGETERFRQFYGLANCRVSIPVVNPDVIPRSLSYHRESFSELQE
jgi:hypothetical protein